MEGLAGPAAPRPGAGGTPKKWSGGGPWGSAAAQSRRCCRMGSRGATALRLLIPSRRGGRPQRCGEEFLRSCEADERIVSRPMIRRQRRYFTRPLHPSSESRVYAECTPWQKNLGGFPPATMRDGGPRLSIAAFSPRQKPVWARRFRRVSVVPLAPAATSARNIGRLPQRITEFPPRHGLSGLFSSPSHCWLKWQSRSDPVPF